MRFFPKISVGSKSTLTSNYLKFKLNITERNGKGKSDALGNFFYPEGKKLLEAKPKDFWKG